MDDTDDQAAPAAGTPAPARRSRRGPLWIALVVVLVGGLAGGLVVANRGASGGHEAEARAALRDARTALARAQAYRYRLVVTGHGIAPDAGASGGPDAILGEVRGDDWHVRDAAAGTDPSELFAIGGGYYMHPPDGDAGPGAWQHWPAPATAAVNKISADTFSPGALAGALKDRTGGQGVDQQAMVVAVGALYLRDLTGAGALAPGPADPSAVLDGLAHLTVVRRHGGVVTVRATKPPPPELAAALKGTAPSGTVELDVDEAGRPRAMRLTVTAGQVSVQADLRWSDWDGADIVVAEPTGDIDETPWLDEQAVARLAARIPPVGPTVLPAGWTLHSIEALDDGTAAAGGEDGTASCPMLDLGYGPADGLGSDGVDIDMVTAACARTEDPTPFAPGVYGAVPVRTLADNGVDVLLGSTVAEISGSLTKPQLVALVASLRPLDLRAAEAQVGEQVRRDAVALAAAGP